MGKKEKGKVLGFRGGHVLRKRKQLGWFKWVRLMMIHQFLLWSQNVSKSQEDLLNSLSKLRRFFFWLGDFGYRFSFVIIIHFGLWACVASTSFKYYP